MTSRKLNLFLDIDNVLNAGFAFYFESKAWPDFKYVDKSTKREIISPKMIEQLNDFIAEYDPKVYIVSNREERSQEFCQLIGLRGTENWPWLNATVDIDGMWGKFHSVVHTVTAANGEVAPAIWLDDDIADEHDAELWAAENGVLAIAPRQEHGITPGQLAQMRAYAENLKKIPEKAETPTRRYIIPPFAG